MSTQTTLSTATLPDSARCWVYQAATEIPEALVPAIEEALRAYTSHWESHGSILPAGAEILHNRFVLIAVDPRGDSVCGRSVDASVRLMRDLSERFGVDFFDRMQLAYLKDGEVRAAHKDEFAALYAAGEIGDDTLVFDNMVQTLGDWRKNWLKPLKESWVYRMIAH